MKTPSRAPRWRRPAWWAGLCLALLAVPAAAAPPAAPRLSPEGRARLVVAVAAYRAGQHPAAARAFAEAVAQAAPVAEYALYLRAESLASAGDAAAARAAAEQAVDRAGDGPLVGSALLLAARSAQRAGDAAGAAALFRRLLDRQPDHPEAPALRLALGQTLEGAGQGPEAARAYRALWLALPATGEAAEAAARELALAARGVVLPPATPRERLERAERLLAAGRGAEARVAAEALLAEGLAAEPSLRALRVVTEAARRAGRAEDALRAVERAVALAPPERRTSWLLERARLLAGRVREAGLAALERLARDHPQSAEAPEALWLRAQLLETGPRAMDAEAAYHRLLQDYPDDERAAAARWQLGWRAWFRGAPAEAARHWSRLAVARSAPARLREGGAYWAGRAYREQGDAAEADRQWGALVAQIPGSYYGVLAARRLGPAPPAATGARPAVTLPPEPLELLKAEPRWAKVEALREVGLLEFVTPEIEELGRRAGGDLQRLYAVSAAHVQEQRYHLALRILRRDFVPLARSGDAAAPRPFWEMYYPIGFRPDLEAAAARAALDPFLVAAVTREESSYDPRARSRVGARGLMQLMPETARPMVAARGLAWQGGDVLETPAANLDLGAAFLAGLLRDFGDARLAVAAYNAGPRRVREWWATRRGDDVEVWVEQIPFNETRFFVKRVMVAWEEYRRLYGAADRGAPPPGPRP